MVHERWFVTRLGLIVWGGGAVIADSAQFSLAVSELVERRRVGSASEAVRLAAGRR